MSGSGSKDTQNLCNSWCFLAWRLTLRTKPAGHMGQDRVKAGWVLTPALLLLAVRPWSQYLISPCLDFISKMRDNNSVHHLRSLCRLKEITQAKWLEHFCIMLFILIFNKYWLSTARPCAGTQREWRCKTQALLLCCCSGLGCQNVQWAQVQPHGWEHLRTSCQASSWTPLHPRLTPHHFVFCSGL